MVDAQIPRIVYVAISMCVCLGVTFSGDIATYAFSSSAASRYSIKLFLTRSSQVHSLIAIFSRCLGWSFGTPFSMIMRGRLTLPSSQLACTSPFSVCDFEKRVMLTSVEISLARLFSLKALTISAAALQ